MDVCDGSAASERCRGGAVTIGNFDGVHRGHRAIVAELQREATRVGGPAVVVTFDPPPLTLLAPDRIPPRLMSLAAKVAAFRDLGVDALVVLRTTPELLGLTATEFFHDVVRGHLMARAMVEGSNFYFGKNRSGNIDVLRELCEPHEIRLTIVPAIDVAGRAISSSTIRQALAAGDVDTAATMLGWPYQITGTVVAGAARGRTLGFPTANLSRIETLVPGSGVFAGRITLDDRDFPCAIHIGGTPTFADAQAKVEVHIIGWSGDIYGQTLRVAFLRRLRDVRKFESPAELAAQLASDITAATLSF